MIAKAFSYGISTAIVAGLVASVHFFPGIYHSIIEGIAIFFMIICFLAVVIVLIAVLAKFIEEVFL